MIRLHTTILVYTIGLGNSNGPSCQGRFRGDKLAKKILSTSSLQMNTSDFSVQSKLRNGTTRLCVVIVLLHVIIIKVR